MRGIPSDETSLNIFPEKVSLSPQEFRGIKPKLIVREGDKVKTGSPLFFDKLKPEVKWASPSNGVVTSIHFGDRRIIEKIEIAVENKKPESYKSFSSSELNAADRETVMENILDACIFPLIRQRPFNKVADPNDVPRDIFISAYNTAPLSVNVSKVIQNSKDQFQAGLTALSKLTEGSVYLTSQNPMEFDNATNVTIEGPHPAGNVGIQIHHIKPINPGEVIWTVNAQHVITIGKLFQNGHYDPGCIVSIGGSGSSNPQTVRALTGSNIESLLKDQLLNGSQRIISGDVLTGKRVGSGDYLGFYDSSVAIIDDDVKRPFLGMLALGNSSTKYSLTNTFLSTGADEFNFTTSQNGELRAIVPLNAWEKMLPMDILPNPLYRAILAQDIEEMEQLGIWECDDEDFALCSFACPSKIDVGSVIRDGLDLLESDS
tara:strand:- start:2030 stop:3322 length:1293 start_codon:yes stop_codon:yes gene_type:complete